MPPKADIDYSCKSLYWIFGKTNRGETLFFPGTRGVLKKKAICLWSSKCFSVIMLLDMNTAFLGRLSLSEKLGIRSYTEVAFGDN